MSFNVKIISSCCCCLPKGNIIPEKNEEESKILNEPLLKDNIQNFDVTSQKPKNFDKFEDQKEMEDEEKKSTERTNFKSEEEDADLFTVTSCEWFMNNFKPEPIRILGKGGFGKVYEVISSKNLNAVALKIMKTEEFKEINSFTKELIALCTLVHTNIIKIYDYYINNISFTKNGKEFREYQVMISMEKASHTLEEKIKQGSLTKKNFLSLIKDLATGLQYAHSKKICHNDLKPQNIFVFLEKNDNEASIQYKIGDWGAGALLRENNTRTNFKDGMGFTFGFSAPEIVNEKENINFFKSDIYSLGATLLMCCGAKMKELKKLSNSNKHDFNNSLQKLLNAYVKSIYDEETAILIAKMLNYHPNERLDLNEILILLEKKPNPPKEHVVIPIKEPNPKIGNNDQQKKAKHMITLKTIFLGNVEVGKTSIIRRLIENEFNYNWVPTIGIEFKVFKYEKLEFSYKMQIWDTAGQERYAPIISSYIKGANGIFFVIENDMDSLEYVQRYAKICEQYNRGNYTKILLFNKNDKEDPCIHNLQEISNMMGFSGYLKVSAKTGENIKEAFEMMADEIYLNCYDKHHRESVENIFKDPLKAKQNGRENKNNRSCLC